MSDEEASTLRLYEVGGTQVQLDEVDAKRLGVFGEEIEEVAVVDAPQYSIINGIVVPQNAATGIVSSKTVADPPVSGEESKQDDPEVPDTEPPVVPPTGNEGTDDETLTKSLDESTEEKDGATVTTENTTDPEAQNGGEGEPTPEADNKATTTAANKKRTTKAQA